MNLADINKLLFAESADIVVLMPKSILSIPLTVENVKSLLEENQDSPVVSSCHFFLAEPKLTGLAKTLRVTSVNLDLDKKVLYTIRFIKGSLVPFFERS
jgi:hypothetical protein